MQKLSLDIIIKYIYDNVSYIDIVSLRWTCKYLMRLPMPSFKDRFVRKLYPIMGLDPDVSKEDAIKEYNIRHATKTNTKTKTRTKDADESVENIYQVDKDRFNTVYNTIKAKLGTNITNNELDECERLFDKLFIIARYDFCEKLYQSGSYVSGSFILDCLHDTDYHNDIDIYCISDLTEKLSFTSYLGHINIILSVYGDIGVTISGGVINFLTNEIIQVISIAINEEDTNKNKGDT